MGAGCSRGEGKPRTTTSSSSCRPEARGRVRGQHGVERPSRHRLLEVLDERVEADLLAGEPAVEQAVVLGLLDDPLDQPRPRALDELEVLAVGLALHPGAAGVVEHLLRQQADEPGRRLVVGEQRQVERLHAGAEHALTDRQGLVEVGALLVEVGDHHSAGHADRRALVPEHAGHAVDAVHGRDDEEGGIRRPQPRPHLAHEVGVPRGVDEVDLHPLVDDARHGERHRAAQPPLDLLVVADRRAVLDPAEAGRHAGAQEQGLDQGRLARGRVTDEDHVADAPRVHRLATELAPRSARLRVPRHETSWTDVRPHRFVRL